MEGRWRRGVGGQFFQVGKIKKLIHTLVKTATYFHNSNHTLVIFPKHAFNSNILVAGIFSLILYLQIEQFTDAFGI